MKIALYGANRVDNFGDTLFIHIFTEWIKAIDETIKIGIPYASSSVKSKFEGQTCNIKISEYDLFIFIGGGYLSAPRSGWLNNIKWLKRSWRHFFLLLKLKIKRKPYSLIGVAVGNITFLPLKFLLRLLLNSATIISLRDLQSFEYVTALNLNTSVKRTSDSVLAYNFDRFKFKNKVTKKINVGLHLSNLQAENSNQRILLQLIKERFPLDQYNLFLIVDNGGMERAIDLKNDYKGLLTFTDWIIYDDTNIFLNKISALQLVFSNKLHVCIVSLSMNIPTYSIANHPKTVLFFREINCEKFSQMLASTTKEKLDEILNYWINGETPSLPLEYVEKAMLNKKYLRMFIKKHTTQKSTGVKIA